MAIDDKGQYWPLEKDGVFSNGHICYKPAPDCDNDPPSPMGASQEEINAFDKQHGGK